MGTTDTIRNSILKIMGTTETIRGKIEQLVRHRRYLLELSRGDEWTSQEKTSMTAAAEVLKQKAIFLFTEFFDVVTKGL
jgi:hypothetical protein